MKPGYGQEFEAFRCPAAGPKVPVPVRRRVRQTRQSCAPIIPRAGDYPARSFGVPIRPDFMIHLSLVPAVKNTSVASAYFTGRRKIADRTMRILFRKIAGSTTFGSLQ